MTGMLTPGTTCLGIKHFSSGGAPLTNHVWEADSVKGVADQVQARNFANDCFYPRNPGAMPDRVLRERERPAAHELDLRFGQLAEDG